MHAVRDDYRDSFLELMADWRAERDLLLPNAIGDDEAAAAAETEVESEDEVEEAVEDEPKTEPEDA